MKVKKCQKNVEFS